MPSLENWEWGLKIFCGSPTLTTRVNHLLLTKYTHKSKASLLFIKLLTFMKQGHVLLIIECIYMYIPSKTWVLIPPLYLLSSALYLFANFWKELHNLLYQNPCLINLSVSSLCLFTKVLKLYSTCPHTHTHTHTLSYTHTHTHTHTMHIQLTTTSYTINYNNCHITVATYCQRGQWAVVFPDWPKRWAGRERQEIVSIQWNSFKLNTRSPQRGSPNSKTYSVSFEQWPASLLASPVHTVYSQPSTYSI